MAYPLFFPLEVLSTNRILGSSLIKQGPGEFQLLPQLTQLYRGGLSNLFRGFIPSLLAGACRNAPAMLVIANGMYNPSSFYGQNLVFAAFGTLLANPVENMTVRYLNVDYKRDGLLTDAKKLWSENTAGLFKIGLFHALARNLTIALVVSSSPPDSTLSPFGVALVAAALSHPFQYLRVRQMWGQEKQVGENTFVALMEVIQTKGLQEVFKGFGARSILYLLYAQGIAYMMATREKQ